MADPPQRATLHGTARPSRALVVADVQAIRGFISPLFQISISSTIHRPPFYARVLMAPVSEFTLIPERSSWARTAVVYVNTDL